MTQSEALSQVEIFNDFAKSKPWLDIDLAECTPISIVLDCGIDLSVGPDFEIIFDTIYFTSLLMSWKTDTSFPVPTNCDW